MAKFIPFIGEIYTAVESAACITVAGVAAVCGEEKTASKWTSAAGNAWKEYAEGNLIATPIYGIICDANGDHAKSDELKTKYVNAAGNVLDGTPGVGHVKGVVHYAMGDTDKGNRCMESATRTAAVLGAGVLTGGLGAGVALGAGAGVAAGIAYDDVATLTDIAVNGSSKAKFHGSLALIEAHKMNPNELTQAVMGIAGDAMSGAAGAKLGQNLSELAAQKKLAKTYKNAGVAEPGQATKMTMETAKAAKEVQQVFDKNVNGATTKVLDTTNGKTGVGHSGKIQAEIRAQNFQENGFSSKTAARKSNTYRTPSDLQQRFPDVKQAPGRSVPQGACAEQQAFSNYNGNNPGYKIENTRTATVYNKKGGFSTIERCDNCRGYGPNMGEVITDKVPTGTPVPTHTYVTARSTVKASATAAGGSVLKQSRAQRQ